jgi:hypothetical protein
VFREYLTAERVDLDLADDGHPGPLEAEVKAADAGEQGQDVHRRPSHHGATSGSLGNRHTPSSPLTSPASPGSRHSPPLR